MGYFDRHILHGGAKLPTLQKIYPVHVTDIKLGQNVKQTLNFKVLILKTL